MIGTLIQVTKEFLKYEAEREGIPYNLIALNHLCKDPRKKGEEIKVLFINLESNELQLNAYKEKERWRYFYASNEGGQAIGLSWVVDLRKEEKGAEIRKGVRQICIGLKKLKDRIRDKEGEVWLENCLKRLSPNDEGLAKRIQEKASNMKILLAVQLPEKFSEEVRRAFIEERILGGERAKSSGRGFCAACGSEAEVCSSLFLPFFTVEKRGFSPMGLGSETSWKNTPICKDCAVLLCIAGDYLESHLDITVVGKKAYLVPNLEPGISEWSKKFIRYLWEFRERSFRKKMLKPEEFPYPGTYPSGGESLLEGFVESFVKGWDITGPPPFKSISFFFHKHEQKKVVFLYTIPDILPKQLKEVYERLEELRKNLKEGILGELGKKTAEKIKIAGGSENGGDFGFLWQAWRWEDEPSPLNLNPMLLLEALFTQAPPPSKIFWSDTDKILRRLYLDAMGGKVQGTIDQIISDKVALIWAIWSLLYKEGGGMKRATMFQGIRTPQNFWEGFFKERKLLDTDAKRGLFLIGALFGKVEDKQRKVRRDKEGVMPILGGLRGLTISGEEIKRYLFPQLIIKLRQLSAFCPGVAEVEAAASHYLSCAEDISDEEARFIFCLGWALSKYTFNLIGEALSVKGKEIEEEKEG